MQCLLIPMSKWKMHHHYFKFPNRNVHIFGYVYRSTNGLNRDPVWKIQSFFLNEICTVILWQDHYGKCNSRKVLLEHGWEEVPNCECLFVHREKGLFLSVYVDGMKFWLGRNKALIRCGKYSLNKSIWENQHLSWIMYTWAALNDNAK